MTDSDDAPTIGGDGEKDANDPATTAYGRGDPHAAYRQQAAMHFADSAEQDNQTTRPHPAGNPSDAQDSGVPRGQGLPPNSSHRFGAGTAYTGGGPYQPTQPTSSPYAPPPPNPSAYGTPPQPNPSAYGTPPPPSYYQSQPPPALPVIWQRLTGAIDRLLVRGANGELLRQPWLDSIRTQSADTFVLGSYGAAFVFGLILALAASSPLVMFLLCVLWAGLGYLYIALSTRLARQFLEYGICLVGGIAAIFGILAALSALVAGGPVPGYAPAVGGALSQLLLSVAAGFLFGVVKFRVHQAGALPAPGAGPSGSAPPPNTSPTHPPGPSQGYVPTLASPPGASVPPRGGGPQIPYPSYGSGFAPAPHGGGGTAITAVVLSFIGALWNGIGAIGAVRILAGSGQVMNAMEQFGAKPGWPFYGTIAMSIVQILIPVLLLIGGIQLLSRRSSGRRTITTGCVLWLVLSGIVALAFFGVSEWFNTWAGGLSDRSAFDVTSAFAKAGLLAAGLPALCAVIIMSCALSASTRRWCQQPGVGPYGTTWYGPPPSY
jgi:hypothetical protein